MKRPRAAVALVAFLLSLCQVGFGAGTPESTLEEMISTDQVDVIIQHLPESFGETWKGLSAQEKAEAAEELLISKKLEKEGVAIRKTAVDQWEAVGTKGEEVKLRIKLKNSFVSGLDAFIVLEASEPRDESDEHDKRKMLAFLSMQLQDGEWRITQIGGGELRNIEDELGHFGPNPAAGEGSAIGELRTLNTALVTYQATYPDAGFAPNLASLGGDPQAKPSAEHAGLIDPALAAGVKSGYKFNYTRISSTAYIITARPVEFGKTGTRSFFTDESCVIRYTSEDREPNAGDEPL